MRGSASGSSGGWVGDGKETEIEEEVENGQH
jgi:hypothetical protein